MVSKEKRKLYNKRYYAKKSMDHLKSLNTIDETIEEIVERKDHFLMLLFIRAFDIFRFSFMRWFKV